LHLSFIHSFVDTFYINPDTKYKEIVGGNYRLPYELATTIEDGTIFMNSRAVEIQWSSNTNSVCNENKNMNAMNRGRPGVYVRTIGERIDEDSDPVESSLEREFTADYLVITVPFSALRFIETKPRFSYHKNRAISELHYDSATKVLLEFSERFWEWDEVEWRRRLPDEYRGHNSIGGGTITDSANRFIYFPSHAPQNSRGGVVLASYTWSDEANRWDSIEARDRDDYALRGLTDIYGKGILRYFTGKCQTQSWMSNFYSFGEAAVFTPGQILGLYPYVTKSEGPVHFAGEHASMKHAWIEGSLESAIRVALEIRNRDNIEE
jgi:monoamine oxidase